MVNECNMNGHLNPAVRVGLVLCWECCKYLDSFFDILVWELDRKILGYHLFLERIPTLKFRGKGKYKKDGCLFASMLHKEYATSSKQTNCGGYLDI